MDVKSLSVNFVKAAGFFIGCVSTIILITSWAFGYAGKVEHVVENDTRQDERLAKIEAWQEKANEAIITTPIKLDSLAKSVGEMKQDVKTYLINR
jgi:demethoxyubiquinone hydroxylase (CLK1/Coq7/Cat5 family)